MSRDLTTCWNIGNLLLERSFAVAFSMEDRHPTGSLHGLFIVIHTLELRHVAVTCCWWECKGRGITSLLSISSFPSIYPSIRFDADKIVKDQTIHIHTYTSSTFAPDRYKQEHRIYKSHLFQDDQTRVLQRSIRLISSQTIAVRNNQPILQVPVLIHEPPLTLPLLRLSIERLLPGLVVSLEPAKKKNKSAQTSLYFSLMSDHQLTKNTSSHSSNSHKPTPP